MKRLLLVAACALAFPSTALAAYTPKMVVGVSGTTTTFRLSGPETDDPVAKITIYVPRGWQIATPAPGTRIGTGKAVALALDFGGAKVPLDAVIETADPAAHTQNACDARLHRAVWILVLNAFGAELRLPLYVDPAEGAEAAFASWKIQTCLAPPDIPEGTPGRATLGTKLVDATLVTQGIVSGPATGQHVFSAIFTPYVPRMGTPNVPGTVESRAVVAGAPLLTVAAKRTNATTVRITGKLTRGGAGAAGATVTLRAAGKSLGTVRTGAGGSYAKTVRVKGAAAIAATATAPDTDVTQQACATPPSAAPAGCVTATVAGFTAAASTRVRK